MAEDKIVDIIGGFWLVLITTLIGYNTKRIGDIPEKYLTKDDFNIMKAEIISSLNRLHERLDKIFDERRINRE